MAIIQGSNTPITLIFSQDMSNIVQLNVSLWRGDNKLKNWTLNDVTVVFNEIELPLSERETINFIPGRAIIEAKWLPKVGDIELAKEATIEIKERKDKTEVTTYE